MPFVALLDASVLVPAALRDTLLRAAEAELYRPIWSAEILDEVEAALVDHLRVQPQAARYLIDEIRSAFPDAEVAGYQALAGAMPVDEDDRHVAAAAITGHAQVIITQDLAHFPPAALELLGIDVQLPDEFLEHLFTLYPATMTHVIVEQAAALRRPPKTPIDVCDALQLHAPRFAGLVRRALGG